MRSCCAASSLRLKYDILRTGIKHLCGSGI
jgi:hypothetical protein